MERDEEALRDFAERAAAAMAGAGFPRMSARVLMALMVAENSSLTASELAQQLDVSAAAISGAVRYLVSIAMVHRVSQPGSRRDRYELPNDAWYTASLHSNPLYNTIIAMSDDAVVAAGDPTSPTASRVAEMGTFFRFLRRRMPELLIEWEEQRQDRPKP